MKINKIPNDVLGPVCGLLQPFCKTLTKESLVDAIEMYVQGNDQPVKQDKFYSQDATCTMLGFTRPTLLKLRKEGKIHGIKTGSRKIVISHSELEQFMKENRE